MHVCAAGLRQQLHRCIPVINEARGCLQSMGDQSQADDLLDRCLYAFEMAWHHSFSIASANCMLDPERSENKGFLEALFRQLQVLNPCCIVPAALAMGGAVPSRCTRMDSMPQCMTSGPCGSEAEPPRPASPCARGRQAAAGAGLA
jgi:Transcriptional repressor TCF25